MMDIKLEDTIRLFRKQLFKAFWDWLETNEEAIGEKWYNSLKKRGKEAEDTCDQGIKIIGTALWMFNMITSCGVLAGIGPSRVDLQDMDDRLDEKSTKRILHLIASCISLQYLPKEATTKQIPIISGKRFSLKLWIQEHQP